MEMICCSDSEHLGPNPVSALGFALLSVVASDTKRRMLAKHLTCGKKQIGGRRQRISEEARACFALCLLQFHFSGS